MLLMLVALGLVIAGAGGALAGLYEKRQYRLHALQDAEATAKLMGKKAEPLLAANDRLGARNLLVEAMQENGFRRCRLVLQDGRVFADAVPPKVVVHKNGSEMTQAEPIPPSELSSPTIANVSLEISGGRLGEVRLEVASDIVAPKWTGVEYVGGACGGAAVGLVLFFSGCMRLQRRVRAAAAIREALRAMERGEKSAGALSVSGRFGAEAGAWNRLLAEREELRKQVSTEKARESLGTRGDVREDIAYACDALWQGMVMVDDRLNVRYANGAAAIFLQTKRDTMTGSSIEEFIKDTTLREAIRAVASGTVRHRTTIELKRPEQEGGGVLRFNIRPVRKDDTSASVVVMIEDITQQRVADEARNSFVAQATHELRTPLTNIRLYVEQAIEVGDEDPALRAKCLDVINSESRRLERIVGDMLSVSEIEAGSFKLRSGDVRLDAVFEELRADFAPQAAEKGITLRFDLPPKLPAIKGDRDKIVLAIHNLIGNAVKYTPKSGKVVVRVVVDAGQLLVEVTDTGIGIAAEETELIFEKFYRAKDKRVSEITGTGLGLALAREVVRLHGGDISVRSELNKGSTFTMMVPTLTEAA
jgi:PAS domain S-box-containing protein